VTVTGIDDNASDRNTSIQVIIKVDNLSTVDQRYHGINQSLIVTNVDNETAPVTHFEETLSAGANYTCAVIDNGSAMCWGANTTGQLGNGSSLPGIGNSTPGSVVNLSNVRTISTSSRNNYTHTCTVIDNGSAICWGKNANRQLGNGVTSSTATTSPQNVLNLSNIRLP
jgi:hypothetical protein